MTEESLDLRQIIGIFKRNYFVLLFVPFVAVAIAIITAYKLPKRFKSTAVLNIQASYFQNPLINDLIAQVNDPAELQSQRMSLLRLALNEDFITKLGTKYGMFETAASDPKRPLERELFEKTIEYFSMSATNFQISVSAETPIKAQQLTTDVLNQMKRTLIDERYTNLGNTRDSMKAHVQSLADSLKSANNPRSAGMLSEELERVEATLRGLLTKFSDTHPDIVQLRAQERDLRAQIRNAPAADQDSNSGISVGAISKEPTQQVFNELLKKLNYLTVVLDMEKDRQNVSYLGVIEQPSLPTTPTFPDKRVFGGIGLGIGLFLAAMLTFLAEVRRNLYVSPFDAGKLLDTPLLGELPVLEAKLFNKLELPAPSATGSRRALPALESRAPEQKRLPAA